MTDYGHELLFGTFISPAVQPVMHAVDLAIVADRAGLDLATFQDHPYLPTFHDTWTLLSYVASRTERIHVSGNVLNLPLRQPAVLARSAASLDLLSGGRLELGIGAGGYWDAILPTCADCSISPVSSRHQGVACLMDRRRNGPNSLRGSPWITASAVSSSWRTMSP